LALQWHNCGTPGFPIADFICYTLNASDIRREHIKKIFTFVYGATPADLDSVA